MKQISINLKAADELSLIKQYLHLTKSAHGLSVNQIEIIAIIIRNAKKENGELTKVLSKDGRVQIKNELNLSADALIVALYRLRKKKMIVNNKLAPLLSVFNYDADGCELRIKFSF